MACLPDHYKKLGLKLRTSVQSEGMVLLRDGWSGHQGQPVELAVRQRYCSCLIVEFHESNPIHNHIPAFAILWLKEIPDDEEKTVTLPVWKGDLKRAEANCDLANGERLGRIEVRVRFRPGVSNHHKKLAFKDRGLADVMEVLDTAIDKKIEASREEAALLGQNRISYHEDSEDHGWRQWASKEHENKLHRTTRRVTQWKVGPLSNPQASAMAHFSSECRHRAAGKTQGRGRRSPYRRSSSAFRTGCR